MTTLSPEIPKHIEGEIKLLVDFTNNNNVEKLRERRISPKGVYVDIYHHSLGTDSYFCDYRKRYLTGEELEAEANNKIAPGQYLFTSIIEYKEGVHFVSSLSKSTIKAN